MSVRGLAIAAIAERQYAVFSHAQALSVAFSRSAIQRRVANGTWRRLHHGVYAIAGAPLGFESRVLAATLAVEDASASHRTAAALHGLDGFSPSRRLEVMLFDRRGISLAGVDVHRPRRFIDGDRTSIAGIPVTSVARTLFDLASVMGRRRLEVTFDDAIRRGLVTLDTIGRRLRAVSVPGVRGVSLIAKLVVDRSVNDLTDSELETDFLRIIQDAGLPLPVQQYEIRREDGSFVATVDFAYPEASIAIELDSWGHHGSRVEFQKDRVRQNQFVAVGWVPYRFTKADLTTRKTWVQSLIGSRLRASADPGPR